ncbi:MAG TPA: GreA/GreB family elongation factor [Chthoniobacterales bacterium]|jgi:regulator of nucleoside diphosphate kinase
MKIQNIIITAADKAELECVLNVAGKISERARCELQGLKNEVQRAQVIPSDQIPSDVITLNSTAQLLDVETGEIMNFTLVLPKDAQIDDGKISVLAPLGTAMLGYRLGDEFEWPIPYGSRRLKITHVHFQPEAVLTKAA